MCIFLTDRDLGRPLAMETLGLDDLMAENNILLIEWGEKFQRFERERDVEITFERLGDNDRRITVVTAA